MNMSKFLIITPSSKKYFLSKFFYDCELTTPIIAASFYRPRGIASIDCPWL